MQATLAVAAQADILLNSLTQQPTNVIILRVQVLEASQHPMHSRSSVLDDNQYAHCCTIVIQLCIAASQ